MSETILTGNEKFFKKVEDLSGENPLLCIQCGGCSAACPMAHEMDLLPSKLMRLIQFGQADALNSGMIWVCTTCFNCFARCPRGIDVARIIETLRQINLRKRVDHVNLNEITKEEMRRIPQLGIIANLRKFTA